MGSANVGVVAYWPDCPLSNHDAKRWMSFYIFSMQEFGADTLILVGAPVIDHGYDIGFEQYDDIDDVLSEYPDHEIVCMTGIAEDTLREYEHPSGDVLYVIGNDYGGLPEVVGTQLRIETINESNTLWSHTVAAIVLYDRYMKCVSNQ